MVGLTVTIDEREVQPAAGWQLEWLDRRRGIARLSDGQRTLQVVVEGRGTEWFVTLRGRRVPITVQSWRERTLAEARAATAGEGGPVEIRSTLPGLVVAIKVESGAQVAAGDALLTIEAMKMQNEVRAPRAGRVAALGVATGQPVATGVLLLRIE
jgi:biotin carboxyl carrier protein